MRYITTDGTIWRSSDDFNWERIWPRGELAKWNDRCKSEYKKLIKVGFFREITEEEAFLEML
jgi:hypothetical protein